MITHILIVTKASAAPKSLVGQCSKAPTASGKAGFGFGQVGTRHHVRNSPNNNAGIRRSLRAKQTLLIALLILLMTLLK